MRVHRERAVGLAGPVRRGAIPIQFDAVAIGVALVERFTHPVVDRAIERHTGLDQPAQRIREGLARGIEKRHMEKSRRPSRRR